MEGLLFLAMIVASFAVASFAAFAFGHDSRDLSDPRDRVRSTFLS